MNRRLAILPRRIFFLSSLVVALAILLPSVAKASCDMTGRSDNGLAYSGGWQVTNDDGYYDYVQANILVKDPFQPSNCATYVCGAYAWIMMTEPTGVNIAQWGPFKGYPGEGYPYQAAGTDFAYCQESNGAGGIYTYESWPTSSSVGSAPFYRIHYGTDPNGLYNNKIFVVHGTIEDWCGGDQLTPFNFEPVQAAVGTEIYDEKSALPGIQSNPEAFTNAETIDPADGTGYWFAKGDFGYINGPQPWMKMTVVDPETLHTWDADCS